VTVHDAVSQDAAGRSICAECGFEAPSVAELERLLCVSGHVPHDPNEPMLELFLTARRVGFRDSIRARIDGSFVLGEGHDRLFVRAWFRPEGEITIKSCEALRWCDIQVVRYTVGCPIERVRLIELSVSGQEQLVSLESAEQGVPLALFLGSSSELTFPTIEPGSAFRMRLAVA
jgi:hypothetical protein